MKNIKSFDNFINEKYIHGRFTENFPVREFAKWTLPEEPFKRELTEEEKEFMNDNFSNYSFMVNVDKNGFILLGGGDGEQEECKRYITEKDLENFMSGKPTNEKKVYVGSINRKNSDKGPKSWAQDGIFKKYEDEEEAKIAVDKLKEEGKNAKIFTKKEYKEIEKIREQGQ